MKTIQLLAQDKSGLIPDRAINVDSDPSGRALPAMESGLTRDGYFSGVEAIRANMLDGVPNGIDPGSASVAMCRNVIQYLPREQHLSFLRQSGKLLKKDGLLVAQWTGTENEQDSQAYDEIMRKISEIVTGEQAFHRDFPTMTEFVEMASDDELEKIGFTILEGHKIVNWLISPESWADRFHIPDEWLDQLKQYYEQAAAQYPQLFSTESGMRCLRSAQYNMEFRKL